jgi:PAS domain S-box-containing protein
VEIPGQEVIGKSGETRVLHVRKMPLFDANGQPWLIVGIFDDITERRRAEQALQANEEFLRRVIESSRDCIKVLDLDGRLLWMSVGGQRLMEIHDVSSLLGKFYLGFWDGSEREVAFRALAAARAGDVSRFEGYCPTTRGVPKWWDEIVTPILGNDGKPEKLLVVSRDITEHKRTGIALHESEERFRQLAENIRQVFWIATLNHDKVVYISPAYEEIWGRSRHLLYRDPLDWMRSVHPDDRPAVQKGIENIARGESLNAEYRIIHPDGTLRWIRDRSYQMKAGDGTPLACGIAEDITDSKRAEQERLTHALRQRDALVREVHHRIKNSLQGVVGLLHQKIRKYPAIAPGIEEAITQLQSVATVYGLQGRELERQVSLAEILDAICTSAENLTGGSVVRDINLDNGQGTHVDEAEAVPLAVALNELVFNALKHQPAEAGEKRARVALRETKDAAEICITNRGRLPAGFDFAGGRAVGHGLGLVRTLIALPGGAITFTGSGEEVEVVLKLSPPLLAERERAFAR